VDDAATAAAEAAAASAAAAMEGKRPLDAEGELGRGGRGEERVRARMGACLAAWRSVMVDGMPSVRLKRGVEPGVFPTRSGSSLNGGDTSSSSSPDHSSPRPADSTDASRNIPMALGVALGSVLSESSPPPKVDTDDMDSAEEYDDSPRRSAMTNAGEQ